MIEIEGLLLQLAAALGVGLMIGIERERHNAGDRRVDASSRGEPAGVRTFTLTALAGAVSLWLGQVAAFVACGLIVGALVAIGYHRTRDHNPSMVTEIAQLTTFLLGGLALREPVLASGLGVLTASLLASHTRLHNWIHHVLTDEEIRAALLLAACTLIVLPLTPHEAVDPWGAVRPRQLWTLVVAVLAINASGYIALRALGPRAGLPLAGFLSGFVSSTATIAAMAARGREHAALRSGAVAGAALSSVATVVQLAVVISVVSPDLMGRLTLPLLAAGASAAAYAALFTWRSAREPAPRNDAIGRPFELRTALTFVLVVGIALLASALLTQWLGDRGLLLATAVSGLADAHAAAISAASLAASGAVGVDPAAVAVLAGFSSNALSKTAVACSIGDRAYALALVPGIVLGVGAAWAALFLPGLGA